MKSLFRFQKQDRRGQGGEQLDRTRLEGMELFMTSYSYMIFFKIHQEELLDKRESNGIEDMILC